MDPLLAILSKNVRRLRQEAGLSQEKLAGISGLHRTYIGSIERGERNATVATLGKLAKALRVSPHELLRAQR